jgi:fibronectin type 3 domain-containing protein
MYRSATSSGPYTKLNSALVTSTQYVDSGIQCGQTYYYVTTSIDSSDVESAYSNQVFATIPTP